MTITSQTNIADLAKRVSIEVILDTPFSERYNLAYKRNDERRMPWIEMFSTESNTGLIMNYAEYIKEIDDYDYEAEYDDYIGDNTLDEINTNNVDPSLGKRKLEDPYTEMNSFGLVRIDKRNGRRYIIIWNKLTKKNFNTSYARYLMSVKEGRFLRADEHVDHKDEDKANDDISNLQILTPEENRIKSIMHRGFDQRIDVYTECPNCSKTFIRRYTEDEYDEMLRNGEKIYCSQNCYNEFRKEKIETRVCPECNLEFNKPASYFRWQEKAGVKNHYCSKSCASKYYHNYPEESGFKPAEIETRICPCCDTEFDKPASYFRWQEKAGVKNIFCSRSCADKFYKAEIETRICPNCNLEFDRPASVFRKLEKRGIKNPCCSKSCSNKYRYSGR